MKTMNERLTEYHNDIVKMVGEGLSDANIATKLNIGVSGQAVYKYRHKYSIIKPTGAGKSASRLDPYAEEIKRMYVVEKRTDRYIANILPVEANEETIRVYRINRLGIKSDRSGRNSERFFGVAMYEEIKNELPQVWEDSKRWHNRYKRMEGSAERVSEHYKVSQATAYGWLKQAGLIADRTVTKDNNATEAHRLFAEENLSIPAIANILDRSSDVVRDWVREKGGIIDEHYTRRMSREEHLAWRKSISEAKKKEEDTTRRFPYRDDIVLGSPYEIKLAEELDRVKLSWRPWSRVSDGILERDNDISSGYAPDLLVSYDDKEIAVEVKGLYGLSDNAKVTEWRRVKGKLSLITKSELWDIENSDNAHDMWIIIQTAIYNTPETKKAAWRK